MTLGHHSIHGEQSDSSIKQKSIMDTPLDMVVSSPMFGMGG